MNHSSPHTQPGIRSYVLRQGRTTPAQQRALTDLWPRFGLDSSHSLNSAPLFPFQPRETVLEIGFGMGQSLLEMAQQQPENGFVGVEVHGPGVGRLMLNLARHEVNNVRIIQDDIASMVDRLPAAAFDRVYILFPDPWPKKRHHKRRLINTPFIQRLLPCMKPGAMLYTATDCEDYAHQMLAVLSRQEGLQNSVKDYLPGNLHRIQTKYERRALRLGHRIWDLGFQICTIHPVQNETPAAN